jgi:curved DNA-binding protein CbpA
MHKQKNYYEVLGLPRTATTDQIKRRYRELARKYHPDVVADKNFGQKIFMQITEAYRTLVDSDKRSDYDLTLPSEGPGAGIGGVPHGAHGAAGGNGHLDDDRVANLIKDAQYGVVKRRYAEAADWARQAIQIQATNAAAHAVLGDAYRGLGETEQAIKEYGLAVHYNPEDLESKIKRENLIKRGNTVASRSAQAASKPGSSPAAAQKNGSDNTIVGKLGQLFKKRQKS